jgi:GNAT superfamily N-acetyltransferase
MMGAHAAYEQAVLDQAGLAHRLLSKLFGCGARATCLVAELDDPIPRLVGYATLSNEFSTWSGNDYLHMDTLYVDASSRNNGVGATLLNSIVEHAQRRAISEIQWQTPDWNDRAIRFYERAGADSTVKHRFRLPVPPSPAKYRSNIETLALFTQAWAERHVDLLRSCLHPNVVYSPSVLVAGSPFQGIDNVLAGISTMWDYDAGSHSEFGALLETANTVTRTWTYRFPERVAEHGVDVFTFVDGAIIHKDAYRREPKLALP